MRLSAPSKTFLLGEYLALHGGPALVLTHEPRFHLEIKTMEQHETINIPAASPAGKFLADHPHEFAQKQLIFHDPYQSGGGFGASSAQFLLVYLLKYYQQHQMLPENTITSVQSLLKTYRDYAWNGQGLPPSGADLIAQWHGQITLFGQSPWQLNTFSWPFNDIGFLLIKTPQKIATHLHLNQLDSFDSDKLNKCCQKAIAQLYAQHSEAFLECVRHYVHLLTAMNFVADTTSSLLTQCNTLPGVLAAKGCGALGADTLLIIIEKNAKSSILNWIQQQQLIFIADETSLSTGLNIDRL